MLSVLQTNLKALKAEHLVELTIKSSKSVPRIYCNASTFLVRKMEKFGDKEVMVDSRSKRIWTGNDLFHAITNVSKHLFKLGIQKGDIFAFHTLLSDYCIIAQLAVTLIGGICCGNRYPYESFDEYLATLQRTKAIYAVMDSSNLEKAKLERNCVQGYFLLEESAKGVTSIEQLIKKPACLSTLETAEWFKHIDLVGYKDLLVIHLTTSLKGQPKMVPRRHRDILTILGLQDPAFRFLTSDDILVVNESLFDHIGLISIFASLVVGAKIIVGDGDPKKSPVAYVQEFEATAVVLLSRTLSQMLSNESSVEDLSQNKLKKVLIVEDDEIVINAILKKKFIEKFQPEYFGVTYAKVEALLITMTPFKDDSSKFDLESVGVPYPGAQLKIVDENGFSVPPFKKGHILIKTLSQIESYFDNEEVSKQYFDTDGFFVTGDYGYYDQSGHIYLLGR